MTLHDWFTNENNPALENYLYGTRHIIMLVITAILCVGLSLLFYKKSKKTQNIVLYVLAGILLFFEITSRIINLVIEPNLNFMGFLKIMLPMHICSVMVWVFIIGIFTKKEILYTYSVIGGILATIAFLLYPAVGINRTFMSFTCIYSTVSHMTGFVCCILLIVFKKPNFDFRKIWQPFVCFAIMFAWGAICNFVIFPGSDYMYMVNDPLGLNLNFPYQILYIFLISIYTTLFYLIPFIIKKIKSRKQIN